MRKNDHNLMFKYFLVLCFSAALLLAQTGKLHMHLEHNEHSESSAHVVSVHPESALHDFERANHHGEHFDGHSADAVDVSPDIALKNANILNPLAVILLFVGFLLFIPRPMSVIRRRFDRTGFPSCWYLFQPPLRAPPVK